MSRERLEKFVEYLEQSPSSNSLTSAVFSEFPDLRELPEAKRAYFIARYVRAKTANECLTPEAFLADIGVSDAALRDDLCSLDAFADTGGTYRDDESGFPSAGTTICDLQLLKEIGSGAYSRAYLAADSRLGGRRVVAKICKPHSTERAILGAYGLGSDAKILACLHDPVRDLDVLVMPLTGTRTLEDMLSKSDAAMLSVPPPSGGGDNDAYRTFLLTTMRELLKAIAEIHQLGILHLDIKPNNIICNDDGTVSIIDFNLSIPAIHGGSALFRGTLPYASPEVLSGSLRESLPDYPFSYASDVYSLGVVMYEVFAGQLPYKCRAGAPREAQALELLRKLREPPPPPSTVCNVAPEWLDRIILRALAPHPSTRYSDAAEMLLAFQDSFIGHSSTERNSARGTMWRGIWSRRVARRCANIAVISIVLVFSGMVSFPEWSLRQRAPSTPAARKMPDVVATESTLAPARNSDYESEVVDFERSRDEFVSVVQQLVTAGRYVEAREVIDSVGDEIVRRDSAMRVTCAYCCYQSGDYERVIECLRPAMRGALADSRELFLLAIAELQCAKQARRVPDRSCFNVIASRTDAVSVILTSLAIVVANCEARDAAQGRIFRGQGLFASRNPECALYVKSWEPDTQRSSLFKDSNLPSAPWMQQVGVEIPDFSFSAPLPRLVSNSE